MGNLQYGITLAVSGTLIFASTATLIRECSRFVNPETLAFLRMFLASSTILFASLVLGRSVRIERRLFPLITLAGLAAFLHFYSFIGSLYHTTVVRSLSINYLSPVWTFLISLAGFPKGGKNSPLKFCFLALSVFGILFLLSKGRLQGPVSAKLNLGDGLALVSGLMLSVYHLLGNRLRREISIQAYVYWVYLISSLPFLLFFALEPARFAVRFEPEFLKWMLLLVLLPTVLGHTCINASLKYARAPMVSLICTQEVTGGALFAAMWLREVPEPAEAAGALISLLGLACFYFLELRGES